MQVWTPEQLRAFLAHARTDRLYAALLLVVTTGMRRGEVAGVEPGVRAALGHPPRSFAEFARDYAPLCA